MAEAVHRDVALDYQLPEFPEWSELLAVPGLTIPSASEGALPTFFPKLMPPKPRPTPNPDWVPDEWQLSASTKYLFFDPAAGFFYDGLHANNFVANGDDTYTASFDGFSVAQGDVPITIDYRYVRKRSDPASPQVYDSRGPSMRTGLTYRNYKFTDHSWQTTLSGEQFREAAAASGDEIADAFDTEVPDGSGVDSTEEARAFAEDLADWANSNQSGLTSIPQIIEHAFDELDPNKSVDTGFAESSVYNVPTVTADIDLCFESSSWDYNKKFEFLTEGRGCGRVSARYYAHADFNTQLYAGVGPYLDFTLLSYNHKPGNDYSIGEQFVAPDFTVSAYTYLGAQYFTGVSFEEDHSDNDKFVTVELGLGVRTTLPSLGR